MTFENVAVFVPTVVYTIDVDVASPPKPSVPDQSMLYGAIPPETIAFQVTVSPTCTLVEETVQETFPIGVGTSEPGGKPLPPLIESSKTDTGPLQRVLPFHV